jgi:hypothetical protein
MAIFSAVLRQSCAVLCRIVRIWDLRISQENVADLHFADFKKICLPTPVYMVWHHHVIATNRAEGHFI